MKKLEIGPCTWIGDGEGCLEMALLGKSYCETHHDRIYLTLLPEMAQHIIEKEIKDLVPIDTKSAPPHNSSNKGNI
jgi:hypothetical protein